MNSNIPDNKQIFPYKMKWNENKFVFLFNRNLFLKNRKRLLIIENIFTFDLKNMVTNNNFNIGAVNKISKF